MSDRRRAAIRAIEYHLPEARLTNETLAEQYPDWTPEKIRAKVGVSERRIAAPGECSSDLAVKAAERLFESGAATRDEIDYVILCTQSADYILPATACLLQDRLGLRTACGALDINLGCSGYVYGLGLATALIESEQAKHVLFITADTLTKYINPNDKSARTVFGDGAAATLVSERGDGRLTGPFAYGTDGRGFGNLIVPAGGMRHPHDPHAPLVRDDSGNERTINNFYMNGAETFAFSLREVPPIIARTLAESGLGMDDVDLFVMHQANAFMLAHLQRKLGLSADRVPIDMADCGNTVSSTIPIALRRAMDRGAVKAGTRAMLVGFGVGYSWGATLVHWE